MIDTIKTLRYISVQDEFGFRLDGVYDLLRGVVAAPARSETVAVRFEFRLSLRFYGDFNQSLQTSISECWDPKGSLFIGSGFGYSYPSGWFCLCSDY